MTYIPECPLDAALTEATGVDCETVTGQIVGLAFQLRSGASVFANEAAIQAEANWNAFAAASGASKIVYTPTLAQGLVIPGSERNETGRDSNESIGGVGILNGSNTVTVTGMFKGLDYAAIEALRAYTAYSLGSRTRLRAYFILETPDPTAGRVMASTNGTTYSGIEIYNWRVGSKNLQGFNSQDMTPFDFVLKGDWDSTATVVDGMDFNPIDNLVDTVSGS